MATIQQPAAQLAAGIFPFDRRDRAERRRLVRAEVRCHLCAELRGVLEVSADSGDPSPTRLIGPGGSAGARVGWAGLRCLRCGSRSLFLDQCETVVQRQEKVDWSLERPRRGRPPRWLLDARSQRDAA